MEVTSAVDLKPRVAGILWGDAKTGKTTYAMSLPGRKLLINFDPDGFSSVLYRDDFDVIDLSQLPPVDAIKEAKKCADYIITHGDKYGSVIFDSLTTLTEAALHDAINRGIGKSAQFIPSLDAPGLAGYGARNTTANDVIARILRATAQMKLHCWFIAHADDPEYDKKGENIVQQTIMLSGKIRNVAALKVSDIWHMTQSAGNKRMIYLAPFGLKKPMGSRMFSTDKVDRFELKYDIDQPDADQPCALANIIQNWRDNGMKKLITPPK